jgi:beta-phosphoglucomutase-like phosphatase (HAD superfamily)/dTDP-glucose pyrophosphorylase
MGKLFVFDLDGVLLDSCHIHYETLNQALIEHNFAPVTHYDHEHTYNGLSTRAKLSKMPGVDVEGVYRRKQELTQLALCMLQPSVRLQEAIAGIKERGHLVMCASNCIRDTVNVALERLGILHMFDAVFSNEDVSKPKPSPEIYQKCMDLAKTEDTIIFEDSYVGLQAAIASGAQVHRVRHSTDLTLDYVLAARPNLMNRVNVVIPMAGNGSRFAQAGYTDPKPFIPVFGNPMISWVVKNVGIDSTYTFIIRKEFEQTYNARSYLESIVPGCNIVTVDHVTEGAACTVLLAREHIDNDRPILIINSDQYIEFTGCETAFSLVFDFLYKPSSQTLDGLISTFDGEGHPKWSYAKTDDDGIVTEVREKDPFSDHATTGMYIWRRGSDFVKYANQMIQKNIRVNNEFYVVPVFNEAIADGCRFGIAGCDRMWGIGTPEDLNVFLREYRGSTQ